MLFCKQTCAFFSLGNCNCFLFCLKCTKLSTKFKCGAKHHCRQTDGTFINCVDQFLFVSGPPYANLFNISKYVSLFWKMKSSVYIKKNSHICVHIHKKIRSNMRYFIIIIDCISEIFAECFSELHIKFGIFKVSSDR
jgi:hypothetical protein